jgi:CDP-diacylglycerol--glycerol-3-phosphate 3-phosphatidyltransferase
MNIPNALTILRMAMLPVMVGLFYINADWAAYTCLILFIIGSLTDFLDGWIARKYDQITEFGTFMDPISDKIYVTTIMLMLVAAGHIDKGWVIAILVILMREFLVSGLREFLGPRNVKLPVTQLAKWKTATQMTALGFLILAKTSFWAAIAGKALLLIASGLTVYTGWIYMKAGWSHLVEPKAET